MDDRSHNAPIISQPTSPLTSFGTLSTLVSTSQPETVNTPFLDAVRTIIERDPTVSPVSPEEINQTLEESCRILNRTYSRQTGIPPINFGLLSRVHFQTLAVTESSIDSIGEEPLEPLRGSPDYHHSDLLRGIYDPNTSQRLLSGGGSDLPPSPLESPPDSPHDHNNESSSDPESDPDMGDHDQGNPNVEDHGYNVVPLLYLDCSITYLNILTNCYLNLTQMIRA